MPFRYIKQKPFNQPRMETDTVVRVKALKALGARMTERPRKLAGEARAAIQSATDHFWVRRGALEVTREMKPKQRLEVEMAVMRVMNSIN